MAMTRNRITGDSKRVKNLGWLIRHAGEVRRIEVVPVDNTGRVHLEAILNEHTYTTEFAEAGVCMSWLKARRSMIGVTVNFCGERFTI